MSIGITLRIAGKHICVPLVEGDAWCLCGKEIKK